MLVDGRPISPPSTISSLVVDGEFRRTIAEFALAARRGELSHEDIEREATAQFRAIQNAGITLSHFDTHKHAHVFPQVLAPVIQAAKACGISSMRVPFERSSAHSMSTLVFNPRLWKRAIQVAVLRNMSSKWRAMARSGGLKTPDGSIGIIATGDLNAELLRDLLSRLPDGTWELVCHPGYDDADLAQVRTRLRASRVTEFQILTSPETKALVADLGIEIISYSEL